MKSRIHLISTGLIALFLINTNAYAQGDFFRQGEGQRMGMQSGQGMGGIPPFAKEDPLIEEALDLENDEIEKYIKSHFRKARGDSNGRRDQQSMQRKMKKLIEDKEFRKKLKKMISKLEDEPFDEETTVVEAKATGRKDKNSKKKKIAKSQNETEAGFCNCDPKSSSLAPIDLKRKGIDTEELDEILLSSLGEDDDREQMREKREKNRGKRQGKNRGRNSDDEDDDDYDDDDDEDFMEAMRAKRRGSGGSSMNSMSMMGRGGSSMNSMNMMGGGGSSMNPMSMMGGGGSSMNPMSMMGRGGSSMNPMSMMGGGGSSMNPMSMMGRGGSSMYPMSMTSYQANPYSYSSMPMMNNNSMSMRGRGRNNNYGNSMNMMAFQPQNLASSMSMPMSYPGYGTTSSVLTPYSTIPSYNPGGSYFMSLKPF